MLLDKAELLSPIGIFCYISDRHIENFRETSRCEKQDCISKWKKTARWRSGLSLSARVFCKRQKHPPPIS